MNTTIGNLFKSDIWLDKVLPALTTLIIAWILGRILGAATRRMIRRIPHADISFERLFGGIVAWGVFLAGVVSALNSLGVNTAGLIAALGAAGLAIGLALKDALGNIAAGLLLLFVRPLRAGDYIQSGTVGGTVETIGLFETRMRAPDGVALSVPNSLLWSGPISNFSANPMRRVDVAVGISYSDSIDAGIKALLEVAAAEKRFAPDPKPAAMVTSLDESSVTLALRGWTKREDYWAVRFDLTRAVKLAIEKAGLTIPFPQRDVHIVSNPDQPS